GEKLGHDFRPSLLEKTVENKEQVTARGQIYKKEQKEKYQVLYLKNNIITHSGKRIKESHLIVYDQTFLPCSIGNRIVANGKVQFFEPERNPGNFNQKFYYQKEHIHGSIWSQQITIENKKINFLSEGLFQLRNRWTGIFYHALGHQDGAVLCAVLLGEKGELDPELKELYQKNGIAHILAISGLHISFLGLGLYQLLRKAGCSYKVAGTAGVTVLSLYVLMIGMGVSSIRAYLMFVLRIGADVTGRAYDMTTSAAIAAGCIIMWRPLYLFDAGFLLSFGAICGIAVICPAVALLFPCKCRGLQGLSTSLGIHLMMLPILLYFFFEFPLYSFFLNLIVIPLMSVLLGVAMVGSATAFIWWGGGAFILKSCKLILVIYEWLCQVGIQLPFSRIVFGQPKWQQIVLYYAGLLIVVWLGYHRMSYKKAVTGIAIMLLAGMVAVCGFGHQNRGKVRAVMLDVGQGDGIFLKGPKGFNYFFDGGSSDVKQVGKYRMEPFLKSQGVGTLDYVFISHGDADHFNGIEEMLKRQKVGIFIKTLVLPCEEVQDDVLKKLAQTAKKAGTKVMLIEPQEFVREGMMTIRCVQPGSEFDGELGNESSLVFSITFQKFDMLLTGDVEGAGEELLTKGGKLKPYDVLKVAHHGSQNSTSEEFLQQVQPDYALISAGRENRYGHPHTVTLEKLKKMGSKIYGTPENGAIEMITNGEKLWIGKAN
ncbi:MAG: DNA internalization-related competence protein ComEC/Rec2, partial [Lachnospiraceae bacterium]